MDLRRWPHADALLDEALSLPAGERGAFVRRAAAGDADLEHALAAVLAEALTGDGFLSPPQAVLARPALQPGTVIEHYEVVELIGRGGMGEVYRAHDTRLRRDVALKVLPAIFASDPDRLARFRREARVLALLSHPGIGSIYGVAEAGGIEALILELVEGPTLAEKLRAGALDVPGAIAIATHLVTAIEGAHARGILHRDLKPANIKVLADGIVKVLDFGLAKALSPSSQPHGADLTANAPGALLGTAAYMSPEQVRGAPIDARADVWAFGCILFEMLSGRRAFAGDSVHEVLGRVIEQDPEWAALPASTPDSIRRLLRRTLAKDPAHRLGYIGDARFDLEDAMEEPPAALRRASSAPRPRLLWAVLAVGLASAGLLAAAAALLGRPAPAPQVSRFVVPLAAGEAPVTGFQPMMALSPDGRTLVYRARRDGVTRLVRRALSDLEARPIAGTENATGPFFSPDGRWLGFDSDGTLKRVALDSGLPAVITAAPGGVTATWTRDEVIVFSTNTSRVLQRVPASGGEPEALTALDAARGDTLHLLPQALDDGRTILFTIVAGSARHLAVVDLSTRAVRVLADGTHGRALPSGELVFSRDGTLWGVDADRATWAPRGAAVPVLDGIQQTDNTVLHFDVARDGSIVYLPAGQFEPGLQRLAWIDRDGRETAAGPDPRPYTRISLSPDERRIAFAMSDRDNTDVWVTDPVRGTTSRLTADPTIETMPTWSPDGRFIAFRSEREGPGVFRRDAEGAGPIERLTSTDGPIHSPYSWTPDGRTLLFALFRSFNRQAIASVTLPSREIRVLLDGEFAQLDPHVSPDGRWMAYQSDETGRFEIYARPYPDVQRGRWQLSTGGGASPRWSRDGDELFYYDGSALMSLRVTGGDALVAAAPTRLFGVTPFGGRLGPDYEVSADGRRFLFILDGTATSSIPAQLVYVQHWAEELRTRLSQP